MMISTSSEGKEMEKDLVTPPRKKMKQARLSFQKLSPSVDTTSPKNVKKRKISEDSDEIKLVKVIKPNDEQCVSHENNHMPEVSDSTKIEKECLSVCNQETITVSENQENGHSEKKKRENTHVSETSDKEVENVSDSIECKTEDTVVSRSTNDRPSENSNQELESTSSQNASSLKTISDEVVSSNEQQEIEIGSGSSETDSDEISDGDNELNETVEDNNSSSSCLEVTKDDIDPNSSKTNLNDVSKVSHTPKNNVSTEETRKKKLTPKQLLQREKTAKRREEKEKQRKEKEEKKTEEKERRLKEIEQRRKEKKEKEEQKRKEKEEKEKKKQAELEQKSEEKRLKEEERRKKEEQRVLEKRKKDEKKLAEEEAKRKEQEVKKKVAAAFANFFVTPKGVSKTTEEVKVNAVEHFMPFQVKADMRLAPVLRSYFNESRMETFEKMFKEQSTTDLYFDHLKKKSYVPEKTVKTWPVSDLREVIIIDEDDEDDDDVIPVSSDNEVIESHPAITQPKAKLLLFCENRRPPYWGTWTKKSKSIRPTCPFNKDQGFFDYEVDSDDEWEEEEPGESLHGSDDEKESEDEYEVDNEFFVPHGYLSDEENCEEEETLNPETMKAKLKYMELEFEEEMKHKTERIKPRLFGCFWANQKTNEVGARVLALLSSYRAVFGENPIVLSGPSTPEISSPAYENQGACPSTGSKKKKFPESFVPALIKLVHGNINGRSFLVKEFYSYMKSELDTAREESRKDSENNPTLPNAVIVSKLKISEKIKQIASWSACPEEGPFLNRMCWYVSSEIRSAYGLEELNIPNKVWNYINIPKRELELSNTIPSPIISDTNSKCKSLPLITKFTKKMSQEEFQRQLSFARSCGESDIEMQDDIKVLSVSEGHGKMSSRGDESGKTNSSTNAIKNIVNSLITPVKACTEPLKDGQKNSGSREKLLQFKSKGSSIIPHLEKRKRVPILKSGPLGQAILPTSDASSSSTQENCGNGDKSHGNDVKDTSNVDNCIIID